MLTGNKKNTSVSLDININIIRIPVNIILFNLCLLLLKDGIFDGKQKLFNYEILKKFNTIIELLGLEVNH